MPRQQSRGPSKGSSTTTDPTAAQDLQIQTQGNTTRFVAPDAAKVSPVSFAGQGQHSGGASSERMTKEQLRAERLKRFAPSESAAVIPPPPPLPPISFEQQPASPASSDQPTFQQQLNAELQRRKSKAEFDSQRQAVKEQAARKFEQRTAKEPVVRSAPEVVMPKAAEIPSGPVVAAAPRVEEAPVVAAPVAPSQPARVADTMLVPRRKGYSDSFKDRVENLQKASVGQPKQSTAASIPEREFNFADTKAKMEGLLQPKAAAIAPSEPAVESARLLPTEPGMATSVSQDSPAISQPVSAEPDREDDPGFDEGDDADYIHLYVSIIFVSMTFQQSAMFSQSSNGHGMRMNTCFALDFCMQVMSVQMHLVLQRQQVQDGSDAYKIVHREQAVMQHTQTISYRSHAQCDFDFGMRRQPLEHEISAVASERAELDAQAPESVSSKTTRAR